MADGEDIGEESGANLEGDLQADEELGEDEDGVLPDGLDFASGDELGLEGTGLGDDTDGAFPDDLDFDDDGDGAFPDDFDVDDEEFDEVSFGATDGDFDDFPEDSDGSDGLDDISDGDDFGVLGEDPE